MFVRICVLLLALLSLPAAAAEYRSVTWDDLMPPDFSFEDVMPSDEMLSLDDMSDEAVLAMNEMMAALQSAPVVQELDQTKLRLPGYVVPLESRGEKVISFFLVPYFGACIHTPPPPSNQIVYVHYEPGVAVESLYDAVWVSGDMAVKSFQDELGVAGYQLEASRIEAYEE